MSKHNGHVVSLDDLLQYEAATENQQKALDAWDEGDHLVLAGSAGTGKTFLALYMALEALLEPGSIYRKVVIVRSIVPTRDIGFLPGSAEEKKAMYETPYKNIVHELFNEKSIYGKLTTNKRLEFESTSFIRGQTWNDSLVVVDEMQNMTFHELDSVVTRIGTNSKVIFCGDYKQSDFKYKDDRDGIFTFLNVLEHMKDFNIITFDWNDIVRSDLVRDYIITKEMLEI